MWRLLLYFLAITTLAAHQVATEELECTSGPLGAELGHLYYAVVDNSSAIVDFVNISSASFVGGTVLEYTADIYEHTFEVQHNEGCGDFLISLVKPPKCSSNPGSKQCRASSKSTRCSDSEFQNVWCAALTLGKLYECTTLEMLKGVEYRLYDVQTTYMSSATLHNEQSDEDILAKCDTDACSFNMSTSVIQVGIELSDSDVTNHKVVVHQDDIRGWICPYLAFFNEKLPERERLGLFTKTQPMDFFIDSFEAIDKLKRNGHNATELQPPSIKEQLTKCEPYPGENSDHSFDPQIETKVSELEIALDSSGTKKGVLKSHCVNDCSDMQFFDCLYADRFYLARYSTPTLEIVPHSGANKVQLDTAGIHVQVISTTPASNRSGCLSLHIFNEEEPESMVLDVMRQDDHNHSLSRPESSISLLSSRICTRAGWSVLQNVDITLITVTEALYQDEKTAVLIIETPAAIKCHLSLTGMGTQTLDSVFTQGTLTVEFPVIVEVDSILTYQCPGKQPESILITSETRPEADSVSRRLVNISIPEDSSFWSTSGLSLDQVNDLFNGLAGDFNWFTSASKFWIWGLASWSEKIARIGIRVAFEAVTVYIYVRLRGFNLMVILLGLFYAVVFGVVLATWSFYWQFPLLLVFLVSGSKW